MNKVHALHEIDQYRILLNEVQKAVVHLPELERITTISLLGMGTLAISASHDYELMKRHRKQMDAAGWQFHREVRFTDDGTLGQFYRMDQVEMNIYYRPEMEGSTCQVKVIGTQASPIVEVICKDAKGA